MLAWGEELVPLVDGGEVRSVHDGVFLHQAQPAADLLPKSIDVFEWSTTKDIKASLPLSKAKLLNVFVKFIICICQS